MLRRFFHAGCFLLAVTGILWSQPGDFIVAQDGSGHYRTLQEAIDACRDYAERTYVIVVKPGVYREKLVIPAWKRRIHIIGEDVERTTVTYDDYSGKMDSNGRKHSTFTSHTCIIEGNDIDIENITFENSAGQVGQAVAVHVEGDRVRFRNCRFVGNQDTLFASGDGSRQYYQACHIEGTTDFIFGAATAVFERCTIVSKKNSYITAASTNPTQQYGFVFLDCKVVPDSAGRKVYLGRPWRLHAYTAFVRCELGAHILPAGWHNWSKPEAETTARYYEYGNTGPGASREQRVGWSKTLTQEEAKALDPAAILKGNDGWDCKR